MNRAFSSFLYRKVSTSRSLLQRQNRSVSTQRDEPLAPVVKDQFHILEGQNQVYVPNWILGLILGSFIVSAIVYTHKVTPQLNWTSNIIKKKKFFDLKSIIISFLKQKKVKKKKKIWLEEKNLKCVMEVLNE